MSSALTACPKCLAEVTPDQENCPSCGQKLQSYTSRKTIPQQAVTLVMGGGAETACPECGEMVRNGLVRCWSCGAFMKAEIAAHYEKIQQRSNMSMISGRATTGTASEGVEEDDFELSPDVVSQSGSPVPKPSAPQVKEEVIGIKKEPEEAAQEKTEAPAEKKERRGEESDEADLFDIALKEQQEAKQRQKKRRLAAVAAGAKTSKGGFIIFCPFGHRIEVQERHRGMTGRCPKCKSPFVVPAEAPKPMTKEEIAAKSETGLDAGKVGRFGHWVEDLHVHQINPEKLKLKADSLLKEFAEMDFAFASGELVIVSLAGKKGGLFASGDKKKPQVRTSVMDHLRGNKPLDGLPVQDKWSFDGERVAEMKVVQPAASKVGSMFAGIPVFGTGRIAVQLPLQTPESHPWYVSFKLSEFRNFAQILEESFGIKNFGVDAGVPLTDTYESVKCHVSGHPIRVLKGGQELYRADTELPLRAVAWKCGSCGVVVGETSRAETNLGGPSPKGLAKAKCPKCQQKFGENPLYVMSGGDRRTEAASESEEPESE